MTTTSHSSRAFYTPLLISLAGMVFTSLVIAAYHLILVRFCLRRRRLRRLASTRHLNQMPAETGVDQKVLAAIPILCFSTNNVKCEVFRVDQTECVVCLGELEEGDSVRLLPYCRHAFHVPCIDKWFSAHRNCPICRAPMSAVPIIMENPLHIEIRSAVQEGDDGVDNSTSTLRSVRSGGVPRHFPASLMLPKEVKLPGRLKRSFSMGQSYVVINIQGERDKAVSAASTSSSSSSSSCSIKDVPVQSSRPYRSATASVTQLDHMSSTLFGHLSQLGLGLGSTSPPTAILPY